MISFETDDVLFEVLNASTELKNAINGGIYVQGERPDNSSKEDIVINNITVTHELPQSGASNVNIHVADLNVKINGQEQRKANRERLRTITSLVLSILKAARIEGLTFWVTNETVIKEPAIKQHYNNLRISWNIHK